MRVLDFGVDKYGLNAWIFDSTNDGATNYDKVLFSRTKSAADSVGILRKGQWADVKVTIQGGALNGLTAGMLIRVEELTAEPVARPPLPHLGQPRDRQLADVAGRSRLHRRLRRVPRAEVPDLDGRRLRDPRGGRRLRGDVRRAGPLLEDGAPADARVRRREVRPDLLLAGMPTTDEFQHQFLGLVSPKLPDGAPNPAYDDVDLNRVPDGRVAAREAFIRTAYEEADEVLTRPAS